MLVHLKYPCVSSKFVGEDSCLWQSPHGTHHFDINVSIVDLVDKMVLTMAGIMQMQSACIQTCQGEQKVKFF
jgi:hypothetical protein